MKNELQTANSSKDLNCFLLKPWNMQFEPGKILSSIMFIVSCKGIWAKRLVIPYEHMVYELKLLIDEIFFEISKEFLMVQSLVENGSNIGTMNLAILYVVVLFADRIGLKGVLSLCTLGNPYMTPGDEPEILRSLYWDSDKTPSFFSLLSVLLTLSS